MEAASQDSPSPQVFRAKGEEVDNPDDWAEMPSVFPNHSLRQMVDDVMKENQGPAEPTTEEEARALQLDKLKFECGKLLYDACREGDADPARQLLSDPLVNPNFRFHLARHMTPLHVACVRAHLPVIEVLLADERVDVNERDEGQRTPLMSACERGNYEVVTRLLRDPRVRVNIVTSMYWSPLYCALKGLHVNCVQGDLAKKKAADLKGEQAEESVAKREGAESEAAACAKTCARLLQVTKLLLASGRIRNPHAPVRDINRGPEGSEFKKIMQMTFYDTTCEALVDEIARRFPKGSRNKTDLCELRRNIRQYSGKRGAIARQYRAELGLSERDFPDEAVSKDDPLVVFDEDAVPEGVDAQGGAAYSLGANKVVADLPMREAEPASSKRGRED